MLTWSSLDLRPRDPIHMLWRLADGAFPCFVSDDTRGPVGWIKCSHRGVLWLERLHIGDKQRRQVLDPRFEFRCNTAFEQVVRACADRTADGFTWITEELIEGLLLLHEMGFAHSLEAWENGQLVGGAFGPQLGGMLTIQSIFHRANNAGKAALVRGMLHLRDRGFELIDMVFVSEHLARWGTQWMPQGQFERTLRRLLNKGVSIDDGRPAPPLPWQIRLGLPLAHGARGAAQRIKRAGQRVLAAAHG